MSDTKIKGPIGGDELRDFAEDASEIDEIVFVKKCGSQQLEVRTEIVNPDWGLPDGLHSLIVASGASINDFSHVSEGAITLYVSVNDSTVSMKAR